MAVAKTVKNYGDELGLPWYLQWGIYTSRQSVIGHWPTVIQFFQIELGGTHLRNLTDRQLSENEKKSLKFLAFQMFERFKCEIIQVWLSI